LMKYVLLYVIRTYEVILIERQKDLENRKYAQYSTSKAFCQIELYYYYGLSYRYSIRIRALQIQTAGFILDPT
jgi:hypothetical protein